MQFDVIGVGESDIDIFLKVEQLPERGGKIRAREIGKFPGGMIGNFCSGVAKHGLNCGIVSVVGDDENGKIVMDDYRNRGIDISQLKVKKDGQTFYCIVFVDNSGEKYLTAVETPLISPKIDDIDFEYLEKARYVHMNSFDYTLAYEVSHRLKDSNTKISLDYESHAENPGLDSWKTILENTSLLFTNEHSIRILMNEENIEKAAKQIIEIGVEYVVVTCAEKGGYVFTHDSQFSYKAYKAEKIVDTTGAGDCFNAAFLSSLLKGWNIEQCMRYSAAASALLIQKFGARTGLATTEEIKNFLDRNPEMLP